MKSFKNKLTKISVPVDSDHPEKGVKKATYSELCINIMESEARKGIDFAEMKKRLRLSSVLEKAHPNKVIKIEDADHQKLVGVLTNATYSLQHKDIETMITEIEEAK